MAIERKIFKSEIKSFDDKNLIIEHFISTDSVDDGGDVMEPEGMVARGRVVVLFQHGKDINKGTEPIARPLSFTVGVNKNGSKGIIAKTQYYNGEHLVPPDNTGRRLYEKAKGGFMPNWSIGWEPIEITPTSDGTRRVKKWRLFEYSQVAVGMNEDAANDIDGKLFPSIKYEGEDDGLEKPITFKEIPEEGNQEPKEKQPDKQPPEKADIETHIKAIAEQLSVEMPIRNIEMINNAVISELFKQAYNSETVEDELVKSITFEYVGLVSPHMKACASDIRRRKRENKSFENIISEVKNFPAVPAPEKKDTSEDKQKPPEPEIVLKLSDEAPETKIPFSEANIAEMFKAAIGEYLKPALDAEMRKLSGKLD